MVPQRGENDMIMILLPLSTILRSAFTAQRTGEMSSSSSSSKSYRDLQALRSFFNPLKTPTNPNKMPKRGRKRHIQTFILTVVYILLITAIVLVNTSWYGVLPQCKSPVLQEQTRGQCHSGRGCHQTEDSRNQGWCYRHCE